MNHPEFDASIEKLVEQRLETISGLQQASGEAVATLLKLMVDHQR
jgi:hypothetical protein